MYPTISRIRTLLAAATCLFTIAGTGSAFAGIYPTPTLPPPGAVYAATSGAGCFDFFGVCVTPGTLSGIVPISSTIDTSGQDIVANAVFTTALTDLAGHPLGAFVLAGTFEELVLGRTSPTELGDFTTELLNLDLTGSLAGHTVTLGLNDSHLSTGSTSVEQAGGSSNEFLINSFFDIFVELSIDTNPPITTTRGPLRLTLVPEPTTLALLGLPLIGLIGLRRRS